MSALDDTLVRLYARRTFGVKLGLESMELLLAKLGNPEQELACVHVAGTNGKGSVCAMLESILCEAGLNPGMYTSPHLVRFHERFRIAGREIEDAELVDLVEVVDAQANAVAAESSGREITFFEFATAMAFEHFRRSSARLVVLETGMGGRLDATNVVTPLLSVITRIDLDHAQHLGPDIRTIAAEKCGIIKPGRPVVCGAMPLDASEVVRSVARDRSAPLVEAEAVVSIESVSCDLDGQKLRIASQDSSYGTCRMPLIGPHQAENVATCIATLEELGRAAGLEIGMSTVREGLAAVRWPARFQVLSTDPPVILDGAHNPGGAVALVASWRRVLNDTPMGLILGRGSDRDDPDYLKAFAGLVKRCWTVPVGRGQCIRPAALAAATQAQGWDAKPSTLDEALPQAREWAAANRAAVCITGSLYLAGEVLDCRRRDSNPHDVTTGRF
jgi:dihydrofolate synthase/folylpolyglutamate synthase